MEFFGLRVSFVKFSREGKKFYLIKRARVDSEIKFMKVETLQTEWCDEFWIYLNWWNFLVATSSRMIHHPKTSSFRNKNFTQKLKFILLSISLSAGMILLLQLLQKKNLTHVQPHCPCYMHYEQMCIQLAARKRDEWNNLLYVHYKRLESTSQITALEDKVSALAFSF